MAATTTATQESICAKYFGDKQNVKTQLCEALKQAREGLNLTQEQVDIFCGNDGQLEFISGLPKCAQYEKDPSLMSGKAFSIVSQALMVDVDRVGLEAKISQNELAELGERLHKQGFGLVRTAGGRVEANEIAYSRQVPMLLLLAALHELDEQ